MTREVVVVSGVRTAIGTFGGSLKDTPPTELAALVVRESLARAGVDGKDVGHVVFGHVVNTEPKDMYLSRVAAVNGGCAEGTPAFNVNRLCGSGLQAIISASQSILLGDADIAIGGGAENMSRGPYASLATRFGARLRRAACDRVLVPRPEPVARAASREQLRRCRTPSRVGSIPRCQRLQTLRPAPTARSPCVARPSLRCARASPPCDC